MPIIKSAKKALRSSEKKRAFNLARKNEMKKQVKGLRKLVSENKIPEAEKAMPAVQKAIDKAAKKGIIKKNTAARKKSRLVKLIKKSK